MSGESPKQILFIASDLLGESLSLQLTSEVKKLEICLKQTQLTRHPSLVIWSIDNIEIANTTIIELKKLKEKWRPTPVLLLFPARIDMSPSQLLNFECEGILQDPDIELLKETILTLTSGGRVVRINESEKDSNKESKSIYSLGNWLLTNSLETINKELVRLDLLTKKSSVNFLLSQIINGRRREIQSARSLLVWIWAPIYMAASINEDSRVIKQKRSYSTSITIPEKNSSAVWQEINTRIKESIESGTRNATSQILAIQALNPQRKQFLFGSLLKQLDNVIIDLKGRDFKQSNYIDEWNLLEQEMRKQSVRDISGIYNRLLLNGEHITILDHLFNLIDLQDIDEELPSPLIMLDSLILDKPILIDGNLLPSDDPRALIKLEILIMNWIVRTAEIISMEIISACSEWPELREYFLKSDFISTRDLERLRNQLNSQRRWQYLIERPIQLYESKRQFLRFSNGSIEEILFNEARDYELHNLGWWQKQVALTVEARDAISPQLQYMVKYVGNLMVIILTNVLGRAIGLVGRGIAQGMGRTISR